MNAPSLSSQLRALAIQVAQHEKHTESADSMLDQTFDLHNELTAWILDTSHDEAAEEISAILEKYITRPKVLSQTRSG